MNPRLREKESGKHFFDDEAPPGRDRGAQGEGEPIKRKRILRKREK